MTSKSMKDSSRIVSVQKIATHIQAQVIGNSNFSVEGVASYELATSKEIAFITQASMLEKTKAQVLLTCEEYETSKTLLITPNPKLSFAKTLELFQRPPNFKSGIDSRAWVEEGSEIDPTATVYPFATIRTGAKIGKNVIVYPGTYIGEETLIDEDCILYPNVTVFPNTQVGKRVLIHAGSVLGDDGFGYVWDGKKHYKTPQIGKVVIEDDVEIGANTTIDRATTSETRIKRGTKIDNLVQIGHNNNIGEHCILCSQVGLAGSVVIGDGSMLGGQVGIKDHVTIGPKNQIVAQSGIMRDTQANETIAGSPAIKITDWFKMVSLMQQLPEMKKTIQDLKKQIEELKNRK